MITGLPPQIIAPTALKVKNLVFFPITSFLLRIELLTLRSGNRKPTLTRLLSLISALYNKRFARYAKRFENRASKTVMALHHIFVRYEGLNFVCKVFTQDPTD